MKNLHKLQQRNIPQTRKQLELLFHYALLLILQVDLFCLLNNYNFLCCLLQSKTKLKVERKALTIKKPFSTFFFFTYLNTSWSIQVCRCLCVGMFIYMCVYILCTHMFYVYTHTNDEVWQHILLHTRHTEGLRMQNSITYLLIPPSESFSGIMMMSRVEKTW